LELGWGPGTRVIGAVGRLCEQKNHAFLIEAFALAVKQRPELRLAIVGEGPLRAELEQQIQRLRLDGRVRLMGLRGDVPELMLGLFDAFAMPSHHEGLPLALLEAQAAGLPSIGSEFGVIRGGLDQLFTLTMAVSDPQKWVSGLIEAVDARRTPVEAACSKMAAGGFGIEGSWRRLTAIYEARAASEAAA
jgi:glycosyltransferase involved in cell wall biosynthesis